MPSELRSLPVAGAGPVVEYRLVVAPAGPPHAGSPTKGRQSSARRLVARTAHFVGGIWRKLDGRRRASRIVARNWLAVMDTCDDALHRSENGSVPLRYCCLIARNGGTRVGLAHPSSRLVLVLDLSAARTTGPVRRGWGLGSVVHHDSHTNCVASARPIDD